MTNYRAIKGMKHFGAGYYRKIMNFGLIMDHIALSLIIFLKRHVFYLLHIAFDNISIYDKHKHT